MSDREDGVGEEYSDGSEPIRIVGAEPASQARSVRKDSNTLDPSDPVGIGRPRSIFDQIPDAPPSFLEGFSDEDLSLGGSADVGDPDDRYERDASASRRSNDSADVAVIRVDAPTDDMSHELELPHWTDPPTGQVPAVFANDEDDDKDSWSQYGSTPRWQDASSEFDAETYADVSDLGTSLPRIGALDERERPAIDEFFDFDNESNLGADLNAVIGRERSEAAPRGTRHGGAGPATEEVTSLNERRGPDPTGGQEVPGRRPPGAPDRNMALAAGVGVGLAAVAIVLLRLGSGPTMVLVAAILAVGAAEFFQTARTAGFHPATLVGLAATAGMPAAVYWRGPEAVPLVMFLAVVFTLLWYLFGVDSERPPEGAAITVLGVAYIGVLGSFAALILRGGAPVGTNILLALIIPTVSADVFAYVVGKNAGRSPLSAVSSNKTVEGLLGGIAGAIIGSVLIVNLVLELAPFDSFARSVWLGLVVAIAAPLGDLCESLLKRGFNVKDMGSAVPGHGGVLDRFDAMLFVLPAVYYLARLLDVL